MNIGKTAHNSGETDFEMIFCEIFRKHELRLYSLTLRLIKSDFYAKDIIQEVFLKLWEHRTEFSSIKNVEAWLYRATENKVIDFLRKASADERLRDTLWKNISGCIDNEPAVVVKEYDTTIRKAIDLLPPQRKLIYYLNKEQGMTHNQIADKLHISRHTVKNQLSDAFRAIRKFFTDNISSFLFL